MYTDRDRVVKDEVELLTVENIEDELQGLDEDILNWNHGHPSKITPRCSVCGSVHCDGDLLCS